MNTPDFRILYEDADIIVCEKPHGLAVQSRRAGEPDMESLLRSHLHVSSQAQSARTVGCTAGLPYLAVIHRLDQPVAGILVFAKTPFAARELNRQLQQGGFGKYYLAETKGVLPAAQGTLEDYLVRDGRSNTSRVCAKDTPGAKYARLHYRVLRTEDRDGLIRSTLEIRLDTGRHHQIRVQFAHAGCPLCGDTKYNPAARTENGWQELKLCAYRLSFRHPRTKKELQFRLHSF